MRELLLQPWLAWLIGIAIGLPVVLVILTEVHNALTRRQNRLARPIAMLRNFIVPSLALLLLLTQGAGIGRQVTGVRLVATIFAFLLLLFILSGLNVLLFSQANPSSWRRRIPSIFVDIVRVVIVAVGLAVLLSQVWGANVGALFTALGVTSIVIGLALQNAVGSIVSGLLLLFEQPFTLGDYLETSSAKGRVVEVNWRAVHIDTGNAIQIIPNSALATGSFANLSQPTVALDETVSLKFALDDSPARVCTLLEQVASDLPMLEPDTASVATVVGAGSYDVVLNLANLADRTTARSQFLGWLWYASRRAGLHLDGANPTGWATPELREEAARAVGAALSLPADESTQLANDLELVRYGAGEIVARPGQTPQALGVLVSGELDLRRYTGTSSYDSVGVVEEKAYVNASALTREPATLFAVATQESVLLNIGVDVIQELVNRYPNLARDISNELDRRRQLAAAGEEKHSESARLLVG
ncbi:MAG: mechanosensitive ion channel family protein [Propionibacteriaceae bacterium]